MAPKGRMKPPTAAEGEGAESDLAMVEVAREGRKRRIVTVRWLRQVVRVLDRLGTGYGEILKLLKMAAGAGVLKAEIISLPSGGGKFLKGEGRRVR
jgi:hypothetical protein